MTEWRWVVLDNIRIGAISKLQLENSILKLVNLTRNSLVLVSDQLTIEMYGEDDEDDNCRDDHRSSDDRRHETDASETDPREHRHLCQEEENSDSGGENPRQFDVPAERSVWRTSEWRRAWSDAVVLFAARDGVDVWQNACTDEQRDEVDCYNESRRDCKDHQQRDRNVFLQVHFNHRYLRQDEHFTVKFLPDMRFKPV